MMRISSIPAVILLTLVPGLAAAQDAETLTLGQAVEMALRHNFGAREARASADIARANAGEVATSFLPRLSANVRATGFNQTLNPNYVAPIDPTLLDLSGESYSTNLDLSYSLISSTRRLSWKQTRLGAEASELSYQATRRRLVRDVALAYLSVLESDSQFRLAEEDLRRRQNGQREAAELAKAGRRAQYEVLQAEAEAASAAARRVEAGNRRRVNRAILAQTVGRPLSFDLVAVMPKRPETPTASASDPDLATDVARRRPEGRMSEATAQAAVLGHRATQRTYFPTLGLFAGYSRDLDPAETQLTIESYSYGATLSVVFSDQAANLWRVRAARARVNREAAAAELIRTELFSEAQNAILNHEHGVEELAARLQARDAARRAFEVAVERYRLGVASQTDRIIAEASLAQAESDFTRSEINLSRRIWELRYALGESMEVPQ